MKKIFLTLSIVTGIAILMSFDKRLKDETYTVDTRAPLLTGLPKK